MIRSRLWAVPLLALPAFTACSDSGTNEPLDPVVVATVVNVSPPSSMVVVGELIEFTAQATFSDEESSDVTADATWATSDASVLERVVNSEFRALAEGTVTVTAAFTDAEGNEVLGTANVVVAPSPLVGLVLTPSTLTLEVSETSQLSAIGTFENGSSENVAAVVDWTSSDPAVATVAAGLVTAVGPGTVDITASRDGVSESISVSVRQPRVESLTILGDRRLPVGESAQFIAEATLTSGATVAISGDVEWSSSAPAIATVVASGPNAGRVTAVAQGEATIVAVHGPSGATATRDVDVTPAVLVGLRLSPDRLERFQGEFALFAALGVFSDGSTEVFTRRVEWASSDIDVAIAANQPLDRGRVQTVGTGTATISVRDDVTDLTASATLVVFPPELRTIQVEPRAAETPAGRTFQFIARGNFSDDSSRVITDEVEWRSTARATVNDRGLATGLEAGEATISVRDPATGVQSGSLSATLTVLPPVIERITIEPVATMIEGDERTASASADFSDGSTSNVNSRLTWRSSNTAVVVATGSGALRAVTAGTATVTATDFATGVSGSVAVTVIPLVKVAIDFIPSQVTLPRGAEVSFRVEARYNNGDIEDVTDTVVYQDPNPAIAIRGTAGNRTNRVFAQNPGRVDFSARDLDSGLRNSLTLTVSATLAIDSVAVSAPSPTVFTGVTDQFRALGTARTGDIYDVTHGVTWASSNLARATVSNEPDSAGEVTGGAQTGTTSISVILGTRSGALIITTRPPIATRGWTGDVSVNGTGTGFQNVGSVTFTASDLGANATIADVDVTVDFRKAFSSCASQSTSCPRHWDIGMRVLSPTGRVITVANNNGATTWAGCGFMSDNVRVTFDDDATSRPVASTPVDGTFDPFSPLSGFNGLSPIGTWRLQVGNRFSGRPICMSAYSITVRAR